VALSTSLYYTQSIGNPSKRLQNSDGTSLVAVYATGINGGIVKGLLVTSTDTADVDLKVVLNNGTTDLLLGVIKIPAGSGSDGTLPNVDLLGSPLLQGLPFDNKGKRCLPVAGAYVIKVGAVAAVSSGKQVDIITAVEEF